MVWSILAWIIGFFPPTMLMTIPFQLYSVYRLARALQLGGPVIGLLMALVLVPVLCVLVFLGLHEKARRVLRVAGICAGMVQLTKASS